MVFAARFRRLCTAAGLFIGISTAAAMAAPMGDVNTPIKIAINEWTGQHISAHIAGQLLEKLGYHVQYVTAGTFPQFQGLGEGSLDFTPEVWSNNLGDIYAKMMAEKKIETVGLLGLKTRDGWMYPAYMTSVCPGLPDWKALRNPACVQALSTPDTYPNGRLVDYPADWGTASPNELKDFNLPYTAVPAGSEGALVAELLSAVAQHKPLLMRFWAPHWVLAQVKVGWLTMPPCDPKDGPRCIIAADVIKVAWSGFDAKWPAAMAFLKQLQVNADDQQLMTLQIDKQKQDLDKVVAGWIDTHQKVWQPWIDAAKQ